MPGLKRVQGLDQLAKALKNLPEEFRKGPLSAAVRAGGRVIAEDAARRAPNDTGKLKDNIGAFPIPKTRLPAGIDYGVEIRGNERGKAGDPKNVYYWRFVELGTSNMPAQPFLRPALATQSKAAIEEFRITFSRQLNRAAERAKR